MLLDWWNALAGAPLVLWEIILSQFQASYIYKSDPCYIFGQSAWSSVGWARPVMEHVSEFVFCM